MSKITKDQAKDLRNAFQCWQQDYDPVEDKEQYDMFGLGMVAMDALLASLYAAPPAQMLEIENLEHFISFWKKVQAGQMKPGKNDIDHMVWFLEGLSNLTTPPVPVSVPDFDTLRVRFEASERESDHGFNLHKYGIGYADEATQARWEAWIACRAAMLQGAEPVTTAYKLPERWVAVPVEPTEDMIVNGFESEPDESFSDAEVWEAYEAMSGCQQAAHRAKLCWAAMLAAAPTPEA